ncbi:MAG: ABC transporter permease [Clostridia bacterium]|nr:ABC transporter permease [Clostridia bacterium]
MNQTTLTELDFEPVGGEVGLDPESSRKKTTYWKDVWRNFKKNKSAFVSLFVIAFLVLFVIIGPGMNEFDYRTNDYSVINCAPDSVHWFGTDTMGRDIWTRVWEGGRVSLLIALLGTLIPEIIGMAIGGISGYFGGKVDMLIMRLIDILMGIPSLIYMILLMLVFGSGNILTLVIAISITGWMGSARATRGLVLQLKGRDFVVASRTLGGSPFWIILRRLIPNTLGYRVVSITMSIPNVIFYEAFLSYIGLGVTPPVPSWGQLIKAAGENFRYYPYQFIIPCLMVGITMLSFNLVGDGLRDALDPRLRT